MPKSFSFYHHLKDGILRIEYSRENEKNEYIVASIDFNRTFEFEVGNDNSHIIKAKINESD